MAREWRRTVFAALAVAMLGGACLLSVPARAANEEAEEEQTPASDAQPKGGKKRQDPAEAQRAIEAALKQVQAGRAEQAVQAMTAALAVGNLPPAIMAKALYVRGLAYRQQRRPAQAISDLNSALWLKGGLGSEDREEATKERSAAYADAGLGGREAEGPAPKTTSGNWLSGLFGGSTPPAEPPAPARPPAPPPQSARVEPAAPAKAAAVSSGWSSKTEVQTDRSALASSPPPGPAAAPAKAAPAKAAPAKAAPAKAAPAKVAPAKVALAKAVPAAARAEPPVAAGRIKGRYLIQLGTVRTEAEAQALVAKGKRETALASRQAAIDQAVLGNMGSFYRVRFGPFASTQESAAVCGKLQGRGFDCLPVAP